MDQAPEVPPGLTVAAAGAQIPPTTAMVAPQPSTPPTTPATVALQPLIPPTIPASTPAIALLSTHLHPLLSTQAPPLISPPLPYLENPPAQLDSHRKLWPVWKFMGHMTLIICYYIHIHLVLCSHITDPGSHCINDFFAHYYY